ncbi:MAG: acyl-CoA dehydrogenase, partial [Bacteroidota bacterium]
DILNHELYAHTDAETIDMMIDAAKQMADQYLFPHYEGMDRAEPDLVDGTISVHESVHPFIKAMGESGWMSAMAPMELGGMQMPQMLGIVAGFIFSAANNGALGFTGLTSAAANLLVSFGSEEQQQTYLPKMFGGEWQGTMALTEPQAGSSLSDITTTAVPQADGTYKIKGQKIYISSGDYQGVKNVVHMLLARIEGAPKGTKGISLFVVPKLRIEEGGELVNNDVTTAGVYHKLGQRGTPATHLMYGEKDDCVGYLVGEANKGLNYMFQMMNEARIMVGLGACSIMSAAYYASLQYAKERPQGRRWSSGERNLEEPQTPIINHADVKRMLLLQKAHMEGGLSLVMQAGVYADFLHAVEGEEKEKYQLLLDILTPVVKTYPSEMGIVSVSNGLQILGGGGFCKDFPLENYYRDIRIYPIYEGTTGIQSMDLLGRKIVMKNGKAMQLLMAEIQQTMDAASTYEDLRPYVNILKEKLQVIQQVSMHLVGFAMKGQIERYLSDATLYMELFGIVLVAWQWLAQAQVAKEALLTKSPNGDERDFYLSKVHTMKFYFHYEVPKTLGLAARLMDGEVLTLEVEEALVC